MLGAGPRLLLTWCWSTSSPAAAAQEEEMLVDKNSENEPDKKKAKMMVLIRSGVKSYHIVEIGSDSKED